MALSFTPERVRQTSEGDIFLFFFLLLLAGLGTAALLSATYHSASLYRGDPLFFLKKRGVFLALGAGAYFFASRISFSWLKPKIPFFLFLTLLFMLAAFIPGLGRHVMGGSRWILIGGFSFQPSELAKIILVLYLASILSKNEDRMDDPVNTVLPPLLIVVFFVGIVFFQNDFSTAIFLFFLALSVFFIANVKMIFFIFLGIITLPLAGIMLFTKEHRVERLITFLVPEQDPSGTGFQIIASKLALAHGGFWGQGLGRGMKKLGGLPEVHSDFLFASLGEEVGYLGIVFIVLLFLLAAGRGYIIALGSKDRFGYYLGFGLTTAILYQAFFNMAVVVGLVPATGIPLPFFSAGGSSLLVTFTICGLLQNIARQREPQGGKRESLIPQKGRIVTEGGNE